ncbi:SDR family NAD(P)-dependent oxidoreductase, partial [Streptomyces hydrogenans]|uniref:SDR family NAD(P)-dependent oxidoreductase n=1 Tax=Streptomyces hydrogenans TaxID=1873719 RepID=UPI00363BFB0C
MSLPLEGLSAIVTGAGRGLGRAEALELARLGAAVVVNDYGQPGRDGSGEASATPAEEVAAEIAAAGGRAVAHLGDVSDFETARGLVDLAVAEFGKLDVLVNNAGRTHVGSVEETDDAELRSLFDVHVFGPAALTRAVLPYMRARRSGAIVQLSSVGGQMSMAGFGAYSATKFALEGMSEALAAEVNPLGIHVLIVEPGAFRTSLFGNGSLSPDTIADYTDTVGATRAYVEGGDGGQTGDPAKAAAAVLAALNADEKPMRLALGDDSIDTIYALS